MWLIVALFLGAEGLELPGSCSVEQYYDPGLLKCQSCLVNASMFRSEDGFSCTCNEHSIPTTSGCRSCSATETVSSDGTACVPRKCQLVAGRVACRKCPSDFVSVTQNYDGSPMKEVQCIKCARGYKPLGNSCARCESCTCNKSHVIVRGACVPKVYVNARPTYDDKVLHPLELLDVVKHEYFCTKNDLQMCRVLTDECVKNFYTSDLGGPCRLWLLPKMTPKGLPQLLVSSTDKHPGEMSLPRGKSTISIAAAIFSSNRVNFLTGDSKNTCKLPLEIRIGENWSFDCKLNITTLKISKTINETISPYLIVDGVYKPLYVKIRKPNGYYVQRGAWPNAWFNRYFVAHNYLSTITNITNTDYLRTLIVRLSINRNRDTTSSLRLLISLEAQYATAGHGDTITTTLMVEHGLPDAHVIRGLEVWGGVLGAFLTVYCLVQWRGVLRRGGLHYSLLPMLAGTVADSLFFSALLSVLHALAAEAGSLGMTLPLSHAEERIIKAFIISAVVLKFSKIIWINWKQCTCDIFFLDWSEYNPPILKDIPISSNEGWKTTTLAREWSRMQTVRRASPGFTVTGTMLVLHLLTPWQAILLKSRVYKWAVASICWWSSYAIVLLSTWIAQKLLWARRVVELPRICTRVGLSLLVFQEENYAHYVHGRNEDSKEVRSMAGPLATCRVACVPQLRAVYTQLSTGTGILGETESKHSLLSKFLAAFFERALDGLNWVASERTIFERLLDVELTTREGGTTSALLYDDDTTPSCFAMTWWGEEWNLSTFDAMLFSSVLVASDDAVLGAVITILVWQDFHRLYVLVYDTSILATPFIYALYSLLCSASCKMVVR